MDNRLVELRNISVTFGSTRALDDVSLVIDRGERVAVIGPSGAGKSTLLGVLNATVAPSDGSVWFDGQAVRDDERWRRTTGRRIATIPQQLHLSERMRVVHNVNAGRLAEWSTAKALWSLVRPVELAEARAALDEVGIAEKLLDRTDTLSGGQQQRVAIARALRQAPTLLLADEPTASLDPGRAREVMELLARLARESGRSLLVSQHDVELALDTCDRVVALDRGRVRFDRRAIEVDPAEIASLYSTSRQP